MNDMHKDPLDYHFLTYFWVIGLSMIGGIVSFMRKVRLGIVRRFSIVEFIGEIVTSAFVGVVTFWLCEEAAIPPLYTAAAVAISGHMGTRLIFQLECWVEKRLPLKDED
jgi:peptidoglycan/LPS O-acetylase OafA/YrhL